MADVSAVRYDLTTGAIILDPDGAQFTDYSQSQFKIGGQQLVQTGTTVSILGGGTLNLGGFTFIVPGTGTAVLTSRQVLAGTGLSGGGTLASDVTLSLPNVGTSGLKTFATGDSITTDAQGRVSASSTVTRTLSVSGLGLSGGGTLAADRTFTLTSSSNPGAAASILASNSSGQLTLVDLLANGTTFNLINTTATTVNLAGAATTFTLGATTGTLTLRNATVNHAGTLVAPVTGYNTDLGQLSKKYKALYASELWVETLVAQNTIATIGGRILVGPTTSLIADLSTGATTIDVKHNQMSSGDRVYLEANGAVEFLAITSGPTTITGGYRYNITRDLDGTGANAWSAGDAVFNTGTTGNGFIDIYSVQAVKGGSQLGPTIVGNVRNSSTYNDWIENWAIGNMVNVYGYGSPTFGAGFGPYASGKTNITVDATNGFRIRNFTTVIGQWDTAGVVKIGQADSSHTYLALSAANGIEIGNTTTRFGWWDNSGNITVGEVAASKGNVYINSGAVDLRINTTSRIHLATDGSGYLANSHIAWDTSGNLTIDSSATIAGWTVNTTYFAKDTGTNATSSGMAPADYSFFAGATYANRATAPFRVTPAGALTASNATITGSITASSGSITGPLTISGAAGSIALGTTPPTSATAGTGIWLDRTGLYALSSNTQNTVLDANGVTAGSVNLSAAGLTITPQTTFQTTTAITWKQGSTVTAGLYNLTSASDITSSTDLNSVSATATTHFLLSSGSVSRDAEFYAGDGSGSGAANILSGVTIGRATSPGYMLDVYGSGKFSGDLLIGTGGTGTTKIALNLDGGSGTGASALIRFRNNGTDAVAIGTEVGVTNAGSNTKATLYSSNSTYCLYGLGAGTLTTDASGNIVVTSDETLKSIDGTFDRGMADLRGLKPKKGHWTPASGLDTTEQYVWLTAQDLLPHIPEAVFLGQNGKYTVDRGPILDTVVNALNELDARLAKYEGPAAAPKPDTIDRPKLALDRIALLKQHHANRQSAELAHQPKSSPTPTPSPTPTNHFAQPSKMLPASPIPHASPTPHHSPTPRASSTPRTTPKPRNP